MKEKGIIFRIVEEGYGGPLEDFSDDEVHTVIRYCPETGSISKAVKRPESAKIREIVDNTTYFTREALTLMWDIEFTYKGHVNKFELAIEYVPNHKIS